jgi:hypothetical protein
MIDINNIINAALNAAVTTAIAPLLERIDNLDAICQTQHEAMVAMRDRIEALENQAIVTSNAVDMRIEALENNPAQGVDTSVVAGNYTPVSSEQFKAALQEWATTGGFVTRIDEARMVEALNSQEWFWEKLQNRIDAATEQAVDNHCETYDHDEYDSAVSKVDDLPDLDDYVTRDEVRSEIEDVLNNATLSLSI